MGIVVWVSFVFRNVSLVIIQKCVRWGCFFWSLRQNWRCGLRRNGGVASLSLTTLYASANVFSWNRHSGCRGRLQEIDVLYRDNCTCYGCSSILWSVALETVEETIEVDDGFCTWKNCSWIFPFRIFVSVPMNCNFFLLTTNELSSENDKRARLFRNRCYSSSGDDTVDKCWAHLAALWTLGTWTLRLDYGLVD